MNQVKLLFTVTLNTYNPLTELHNQHWSTLHTLIVITDLMIWSALIAIPFSIYRYLQTPADKKLLQHHYLLIATLLLCGIIFLLDAVTHWLSVYRLNEIIRFIAAVVSWLAVFSLIRLKAPSANNLRNEVQPVYRKPMINCIEQKSNSA